MRFATALALLFALSCLPARADEMYSYVGDGLFAYCAGTYSSYGTANSGRINDCVAPYRLSGSFTTTLSLFDLRNVTEFTFPGADISAFSFTDGSGVTVDQSNGTGLFDISTDSSGNISNWQVFVKGQTLEISTATCLPSYHSCSGGYDWSQTLFPDTHLPMDSGAWDARNAHGQWSLTDPVSSLVSAPVPTPEPGTLLLYGTALLLMALIVRRSAKLPRFPASPCASSPRPLT